MKKNAWKIFLVAAVVLIAGSFVIANMSRQGADEGVVISDNVKGNPEASVVLVEYSDFQCPACAQFQPILTEVMGEYGDSVRFEYKHLPLISIHPFAVPAAKAAEAAGQQGKFWEMHDKLFESQQVWSNAVNPTPYFVGYAEELGLDTAIFRRHMRSGLIEQKIENDFNRARELQITGTPTFFLNGQRMQYETFNEFRDAIQFAVTGEAPEGVMEIAPAETEEVQFGI